MWITKAMLGHFNHDLCKILDIPLQRLGFNWGRTFEPYKRGAVVGRCDTTKDVILIDFVGLGNYIHTDIGIFGKIMTIEEYMSYSKQYEESEVYELRTQGYLDNEIQYMLIDRMNCNTELNDFLDFNFVWHYESMYMQMARFKDNEIDEIGKDYLEHGLYLDLITEDELRRKGIQIEIYNDIARLKVLFHELRHRCQFLHVEDVCMNLVEYSNVPAQQQKYLACEIDAETFGLLMVETLFGHVPNSFVDTTINGGIDDTYIDLLIERTKWLLNNDVYTQKAYKYMLACRQKCLQSNKENTVKSYYEYCKKYGYIIE